VTNPQNLNQSPGQPSYSPHPQGPTFPPPPGPPPKKKHRARNILLGIVGVIVLLIIISVVAGSGGSNSSSTSSSAPSTTPSAASTTPSTTTSSAPAVTQTAGIGTAVRDGKFQFTVTSVTQAKSVGDTSDGLGDTAQGEYTILHVKVTNIGDQAQTLDDSTQYVYDASGRKYDASSDADIDLNSSEGSDSVFFNDINPGNSVEGQLAFDMPAGTSAVKAELHDSIFSGGITVSLR
jgi:Domain of unknown function (DUF4352)